MNSLPLPYAYRFNRFEVRPGQRKLLVDGHAATTGGRALDLLLALIAHRDRMVTKDELLAEVWPGLVVEENNLTVQISALRKLLGAEAIVTVAGRGYRFTPAVHEVDAGDIPAGDVPATGAAPTDSTDNKPSIVVLPFDDFSPTEDLRHFTDGLTEDITTDLSRFGSLSVVARNSASAYKNRAMDVRTIARELDVRYALEGSVRHANNRIRVSAQLIDAVSGNHLWAEKYDRVLADIFDVQEEVTRAIVGAIAPQIEFAEGAWARRSRPENLAAYGLALRAWAIASADTIEPINRGRDEAYDLAHRALKMDASLGMAWRSIALIQWTRAYFHIAPDRDQAMAEGLHAADRAITLDGNDYVAMTYKGMLLGQTGNETGALAELRAAHRINRNYLLCLGFLGMYEAWAGDPERGVGYCREAVRLSPLDPYRQTLLVLLGFTCFANHLYDEALQVGELAMREAPGKPVPYVIQALACVGLGNLPKAQDAFRALQRLAPDLAKARVSGQWMTANPNYLERARTFIRIAAGLDGMQAAEALR